MKKILLAIFLILLFFGSTISAKVRTVKGEVQDEYGRPVGQIMISIKKVATVFGDNQFNIDVNDNDTLHFELDGEVKKDTVLSDSDVYHIIKIKLSVDSTAGYYSSLPPDFQDNEFLIDEFVTENLHYPEDAIKDSIEGVAHVRFRMNENGERDNYSVRPSISQSLDEEAIRLVRLMPNMLPMKKVNKYLISNCFVPIQFSFKENLLTKVDSLIYEKSPIATKTHVMNRVTKMAEYPGGDKELMRYFNKNLKYPKDALKKNVSARVSVRFKIDKNGDAKDITIFRSAYPELDEEAIKVIKEMPRWTPGELKIGNDSYPCSVLYIIPFNFSINRQVVYL